MLTMPTAFRIFLLISSRFACHLQTDDDMQIYADIDFIGSDNYKRQNSAISSSKLTLYANISFDS